MSMTGFAGFPSGKNPYVPIPEVFFTRLLPDIEDSAELKVTLHLFWLLAQKQGNPRCVSDRELLADHTLLRGLKRRGDPRPAEERLRQGLDQAVARGTLLRIHLKLVSEGNDQAEIVAWYFFNTVRSRKVVAELQGGEMVPVRLLLSAADQEAQESNQGVGGGEYARSREDIREASESTGFGAIIESSEDISQRERGTASRSTASGRRAQRGRNGTGSYVPVEQYAQVEVERPNIFTIYEQNIGLLSPLIAEELKDAADQYPAEWIEAAFREAVQQNKRKWSYIRAILRRWATEGRQQWKA